MVVRCAAQAAATPARTRAYMPARCRWLAPASSRATTVPMLHMASVGLAPGLLHATLDQRVKARTARNQGVFGLGLHGPARAPNNVREFSRSCRRTFTRQACSPHAPCRPTARCAGKDQPWAQLHTVLLTVARRHKGAAPPCMAGMRPRTRCASRRVRQTRDSPQAGAAGLRAWLPPSPA